VLALLYIHDDVDDGERNKVKIKVKTQSVNTQLEIDEILSLAVIFL
jgi:hypothetical protein